MVLSVVVVVLEVVEVETLVVVVLLVVVVAGDETPLEQPKMNVPEARERKTAMIESLDVQFRLRKVIFMFPPSFVLA